MPNGPRFTLTLSLHDNHGAEPPLFWAIGCDQALRISARIVSEMRAGFVGMDDAVKIMRTKEMRRNIFAQVAEQLAHQMADRMEDAEGWHDAERVELARQQLSAPTGWDD